MGDMAREESNTKLLRLLQRCGWRLERRSRHWMAYPPDRNKPPVTIPGSISLGNRSWKNTKAQLIRSGLDRRLL